MDYDGRQAILRGDKVWGPRIDPSDWLGTRSQRDWAVVRIYQDILTKAGISIQALKAHALV